MSTTKGTLYIFSAPSGAGKTSLVKALTKTLTGINVSVSHTTRPMRHGEVNGTHYHFVSKEQFQSLIQKGQFLEHARVFGNDYGTSHAHIQEQLDRGLDIILEIDWQGGAQVRKLMPGSISIFILPPSRQALQERLTGRGQDSTEVINQRLQEAHEEMQHFSEYDYLIINDDFDQALKELTAIVQAKRLKVEKQKITHLLLIEELLA
ncbi:Guanylate kinase [Piscirickettsia salmonis]|uniref:guanylate kinase n=1 Tax=Piscirickettsia salmonis TaxID=1238 RepID=UPI0012B9707F|nr:guanylate kinase [Piscirickettsia salmonis]QGP50950.1 Guanylate kinase [Piscirickettsia salmonis]QGP55655.1 Guanylate kinase [Piscirickettsia salmonis]QGP58492.1 Guanylate kinase [Piscirickettsia salmonis]QGP65226.1 Guanylate kinase [Piscirickettsia salmonis]